MKPHVPWMILALVLAGCSTPPHAFRHASHREHFAITDDELASLQFYVSRHVVAHDVSAGTPGPDDVLVVPVNTAGVVREVGPHWLRVVFVPGGSGVVFLARPGPRNSIYRLATLSEDRSEFVWVDVEGDPILRDGQEVYRVVEGGDAFLLVDGDDFKKLVEGRQHSPGVQQGR